MGRGKLFIVSTPIGNMKDITQRALEVLGDVSYILSEDTRETYKVLNHYKIKTPQLSYRDQNHKKILPRILLELQSGNDLALVSDSGTPLISDPGYKLIREIIGLGFEIVPIPGPSSVISALVASGLPTDKFAFLGFLPKSSVKASKVLKKFSELNATLIIFVSPYRVVKLLTLIKEVLGDRDVCVANDISKKHERFIRGKISSIIFDRISNFVEKGEFIILISKKDGK